MNGAVRGQGPVQTPVIGSADTLDTPTSGDVHLFRDPSTWRDERPFLYADCEGLEGGEKTPLAISSVGRANLRILYNDYKTRRRRIQWAAGERVTRAWMVKNFYPRILFTFSDVVVYVTKNFRSVKSYL